MERKGRIYKKQRDGLSHSIFKQGNHEKLPSKIPSGNTEQLNDEILSDGSIGWISDQLGEVMYDIAEELVSSVYREGVSFNLHHALSSGVRNYLLHLSPGFSTLMDELENLVLLLKQELLTRYYNETGLIEDENEAKKVAACPSVDDCRLLDFFSSSFATVELGQTLMELGAIQFAKDQSVYPRIKACEWLTYINNKFELRFTRPRFVEQSHSVEYCLNLRLRRLTPNFKDDELSYFLMRYQKDVWSELVETGVSPVMSYSRSFFEKHPRMASGIVAGLSYHVVPKRLWKSLREFVIHEFTSTNVLLTSNSGITKNVLNTVFTELFEIQ